MSAGNGATTGSPNPPTCLARSLGLPVVAPLSADMLGGIFGRDQTVHVAIAPGRLAQAIAVDAARLAGIAGTTGETDEIAEAALQAVLDPRAKIRGRVHGAASRPGEGAARQGAF
jgi:hypothetical protein